MLRVSTWLVSRGTIPKAAMQGHRLRKDLVSNFYDSSHRVWGPRFDYSLADLKHPNVQVKVICKQHGAFLVTPREHLHLRRGCPSCATERRVRKQETIKLLPPSPKLDEFMRDLLDDQKRI